MKNNQSAKFVWSMLASLAVVIAATLTLCLAAPGGSVGAVLIAVDAAAAVTFAVCPTLAERAEAAQH